MTRLKLPRVKRPKPGDFIAIPNLSRGYYFGRELNHGITAFYEERSETLLTPDEIIGAPVIFKIAVMDYAFKSGGWHVLGNAPLEPDLAKPVKFFIQDRPSGRCSIYSDDGTIVPATRSEIEGLERAAAWDPEHVQDRLRDHFKGVPNVWLESMKPK